MYRQITLVEYLEDSSTDLSACIGEDEDDIVLTMGCQEVCVNKKEVRTIQRWLKAVLAEAT